MLRNANKTTRGSGEWVNQKPWIQRVGGHVVHLVHGIAEPGDIRFFRELGINQGLLHDRIKEHAKILFDHISLLEELGITTPDVTVAPTVIPYRDHNNHDIGDQFGVRIVSAEVGGTPLPEYTPKFSDEADLVEASLQGLTGRLYDYVDLCTWASSQFMGHIFDPDSYTVDAHGDIVLTGFDPRLKPPLDEHFADAHAQIAMLGEFPVHNT